jgi:hypothetical protein
MSAGGGESSPLPLIARTVQFQVLHSPAVDPPTYLRVLDVADGVAQLAWQSPNIDTVPQRLLLQQGRPKLTMYRLDVVCRNCINPAPVLQFSTTHTNAAIDVQAGHTYGCVVTAMDRHGDHAVLGTAAINFTAPNITSRPERPRWWCGGISGNFSCSAGQRCLADTLLEQPFRCSKCTRSGLCVCAEGVRGQTGAGTAACSIGECVTAVRDPGALHERVSAGVEQAELANEQAAEYYGQLVQSSVCNGHGVW